MSDHDGDEEGDEADAVAALLARFVARPDKAVSTSALGRLRRTAGAALRTGAGMLGARLGGRSSALGMLDSRTAAKLAEALGDLKGLAMKMGQVLSYVDDSMDPEVRRVLGVLQAHSPPMSSSRVSTIVTEAFGERASALLEGMETTPVASASIGQVHRARLPDGTDVAVKVQHPGIADAIRADFRSAAIGKQMARLMAPGADVAGAMAEAERAFLEECDYRLEGSRQQRFVEWFRGHPTLVVPAVHPEWTAQRVLTTDWQEGRGFEAFLAADPDQATRSRIGAALYEFYVGTLYRHGWFNADPHPGNLVFLGDGRVAMLDFGCVRTFDFATVHILASLSDAVQRGDEPAMFAAMGRLGARVPAKAAEREAARALLHAFFAPILTPGPHVLQAGFSSRMGDIIRKKVAIMRLNLPGHLVFLFRIRFGLYAVLARLGARLDWADLEATLASEAGRGEP